MAESEEIGEYHNLHFSQGNDASVGLGGAVPDGRKHNYNLFEVHLS